MSFTLIETKKVLRKTIKNKVTSSGVLLDIGCGIKPQKFISCTTSIFCDPFLPYLERLQTRTSGIFLNLGLEQVVNIFPKNSVDTIVLLDVIEHIKKEAGLELLTKLISIAKNQILVFTPWGFIPQCHPSGIDAWGMNGGKWQEHLSGWGPEDFTSDWDVYGCAHYHFKDNDGLKYDTPKGAIFALLQK